MAPPEGVPIRIFDTHCLYAKRQTKIEGKFETRK